MKWEYFHPKFEYEENFQDAAHPWAGHKYFAYDLVANMKPKKIVELGTHYGTSFWSFCQAVKDQKLDTELEAIDTWKGEKHAGFYGEEVFETVKTIKEKFYYDLKINLIRKTFDEALAEFEDRSIDILHIDGLHTYESVKHDFETWLPKIKEGGIVLLHDVVVTRDGFGVYKLWKELKEKFKTIEFRHSYGLGVLLTGKEGSLFYLKDELEFHYSYLVEDLENAKIGMILQELNQKDREINFMKSSKFWKLRKQYLDLKNLFIGSDR